MDMEKFWEIYIEEFPEAERRTKEKQEHVMKDTRYKLNSINNNGQTLGFYCIWDLEVFIFLEHVAIKKEFQGLGLGSEVLKELKSLKRQIVLEVELPTNNQTIRRIEFYKKNGFFLNTFDYSQPSFIDGGEPVPMLIMSWPQKLSEEMFDDIKEQLYIEVYGVKDNNKMKEKMQWEK